jgi:hypothetical protein
LVLERVSLTCDDVRLVWVLTGEDQELFDMVDLWMSKNFVVSRLG